MVLAPIVAPVWTTQPAMICTPSASTADCADDRGRMDDAGKAKSLGEIAPIDLVAPGGGTDRADAVHEPHLVRTIAFEHVVTAEHCVSERTALPRLQRGIDHAEDRAADQLQCIQQHAGMSSGTEHDQGNGHGRYAIRQTAAALCGTDAGSMS